MNDTDRLIDRIVGHEVPSFVLLHRVDDDGAGRVDVLAGRSFQLSGLADLDFGDEPAVRYPRHDAFVVMPYRLIRERGFAAPDDGAALIMITADHQEVMTAPDLLACIPDVPTELVNGHFDIDDDDYAALIRHVIADEVGAGEGANFVIKRSFIADIADYGLSKALVLYRRLLERERGAYWTFLVHTPDQTLVGATPERHVSLRGGKAVMNPISGTYRYPAAGPTLAGIKSFLADVKESEELFMVLDEELKMMAAICETGCRVTGPFLKEMSWLAHTEYLIEGRTDRDVRQILRETMFAPTVTGSPVESAARVIQRYEPQGRGYYSGVAALVGRDGDNGTVLDSAILIRTAEIGREGRVKVSVGATLVRHSDPAAEVAETHAKLSGVLAALNGQQKDRFGTLPEVREILRARNDGIAGFWLADDGPTSRPTQRLRGTKTLIVDAEDSFTAMIRHQLEWLGAEVTIRRHHDSGPLGRDWDMVVLGPGPGDPRTDDPKIQRLSSAVDELLAHAVPFLAVCLSHQVLCRKLGFGLIRRHTPHQGLPREIELFGKIERVGFYNSFVAHSADDKREVDGVGLIEVSRDETTGEVHALRGPRFASMQFHAESILTSDGPGIFERMILDILGR